MQVLHNALRVLEEVAHRQPVTLTELHRRLGLPKTTVHRALKALGDESWVRFSAAHGGWVVAPRSVVLGLQAANVDGLRDLAVPVMEELRDRTGEAVHLTVPDGDSILLVDRVESPQAVRAVNAVGTRAPMYASANGKAILASLPEEEREAILQKPRSSFTPRTVTSMKSLRQEIDQAERSGFAVNRGEFMNDVGAVASAIFDRSARPVASISVSAPAQRLPARVVRQVGPLVSEAAQRLSAQMGYRDAAKELREKAG